MEVILRVIGIGALILLVVFALLFLRRYVIARLSGTIRLYVRVSTLVAGRGWAPGFARFEGDHLRWYRLFSLAVRPRRVLSRLGMVVESRRTPTEAEQLALPPDWVILRCTSHHAPVEIAMSPMTVAGFLSWLEAAPPGAVSLYSTPSGRD